jgi:hypothetical protein
LSAYPQELVINRKRNNAYRKRKTWVQRGKVELRVRNLGVIIGSHRNVWTETGKQKGKKRKLIRLGKQMQMFKQGYRTDFPRHLALLSNPIQFNHYLEDKSTDIPNPSMLHNDSEETK